MAPSTETIKRKKLLCLCVVILLSLFILTACQSNKIDGRPADKLVYSTVSPDGKHELSVYRNDGRGATVSYSSSVFISSIQDGWKWRGKDIWCLLFVYRETELKAAWVDNDTIRISCYSPTRSFSLTLYIYQDEF